MSAEILPLHSATALARAVALLRSGAPIVLPTETVYGIAVILEPRAVARLYEAKERAPESALPLLVARVELLSWLARPNRAAQRLAGRYWPGPLTLILPPGANFPAELSVQRVALRHPNIPAIWPLLEECGGFLVVSWAGRSGFPPAISAQESFEQLGEQVALILDGGSSPLGIPSTIVDCSSDPPTVERRGNIPEAKILEALG